MAQRPWVTPDEVRAYSDEACVSKRTDKQIVVDIARAEKYVLTYTRNKELLDDDIYPTIPDDIKNAVIILSEHYSVSSVKKGYTSESFDDYSYSKDASEANNLDSLDLGYLLDDYIISKPAGAVSMNMFIV